MSSNPTRTGDWIPLATIAVLVAIAAAVATSGIRSAGRYPNLRVEADPYQWPKGCPEASYTKGDTIAKSCKRVRKYRLVDATQLGLVTTGKNTQWYRVGNDALLLGCGTWGDRCHIRNRVPGKFVPFGYYRSINKVEAKTAGT